MNEFYLDDTQSGVAKYILKRDGDFYSGKVGVRKLKNGEYESFFKFVLEKSSYKGKFEVLMKRGKIKKITEKDLRRMVTVPIELGRLYQKV
jgi:type I restriction-modification system DNA methylase subunit